ncbi:hypothetical protein [Endozoicomonas ascidiicola]|uniref:hypothetical protein n=1 Tax=Endozoicomonas ascidiicola TaxID=1698521 RepID=UPI00082F56D6|nr:hypothetical protein [Endozoicomonas ascidiicola]
MDARISSSDEAALMHDISKFFSKDKVSVSAFSRKVTEERVEGCRANLFGAAGSVNPFDISTKDRKVAGISVAHIDPPSGMDFLKDVYNKLDLTSVISIRKKIELMFSNHDFSELLNIDKERNVDVSFLLMAEMIRYFKTETSKYRLDEPSLNTLKDQVHAMKKVCDREIPERIHSRRELMLLDFKGYSAANKENVSLPDGHCYSRISVVVANYFSIHRVTGRIGSDRCIYEMFSKSFGQAVKPLFEKLPKNKIEVGAGVGLLSAVLKDAGIKILLTSDIKKISVPWPSETVRKKSVKQIIDYYKDKKNNNEIVYLCSSPEPKMIKEILSTKQPILLLVLSEEAGNDTLFTLNTLIKDTPIPKKVIGYDFDGGRFYGALLGVNMQTAAFEKVTKNIPEDKR